VDLWGGWHPVSDPGGIGRGPGRPGIQRHGGMPPARVPMQDPPKTRAEQEARLKAMIEPTGRPNPNPQATDRKLQTAKPPKQQNAKEAS
jgi:hypothetical protein